MRSSIALEHRVRVHVLSRERVVLDTRFLAPSRLDDRATIYALCSGRIQIEGEVVRSAPIAFALTPGEFEAIAPAQRTFRTWGAPAISLELRLHTSDVIAPLGLASGPLRLSSSTWDAIRALEATLSGRAGVDAFARVLEALSSDGIVAASACAIKAEPERLHRMWNALAALYHEGKTQVPLAELRARTGISDRQLARDIKAFARYFALPGDGFRDTTRVLRLRLATLLLSSPSMSITDVARHVGYNSVEAMGRAFRDAHLPTARAIRAATRFDQLPASWR